MANDEVNDRLAEIRQYDRRYRTGAYLFMLELIDHVQQKHYSARELRSEQCECHVSPREIVADLEQFALMQFGLLGHHAMEYFGILLHNDVAEVLFNLIKFELLCLGPNDGLYTIRTPCDWTGLKNAYIKEVDERGAVYSLGG